MSSSRTPFDEANHVTPAGSSADSTGVATSVPSLSLASNMLRNEEILAHEQEIMRLQVRIVQLKKQWEHNYWITALGKSSRSIATHAWNQLPAHKRFEKPYLMALLQNPDCDRLPRQRLNNSTYWDGHPLNQDREVLLARLARGDFAEAYDYSPFRLPPCLLQDKDVAVAIVRAYPQVLENQVDWENFLDDPDVLRALFQAKDTRDAPREDFLRLFSTRLRTNAELMLEALQQGISIFHLLHRSLKNDRSFALRVARIMSEKGSHHSYRGKRWLKPFSARLRNDFAVVKAFCQVNGQSLAVASYPSRRNRDVCEAACRDTPLALLYCLKSKARRQLVNNKSFLLEIMQGSSISPGSNDEGPRVWRLIPSTVQVDREVALAVIKKFEDVGIELMPSSLRKDPSFVMAVAAAGRLTSIPCHVTTELCWDLLKQPALGVRVVETVAMHLPDFYQNRRVWETIDPLQQFSVLERLFANLPDEILLDKDVMIRFCGNEDGADLVLCTLEEEFTMIEDRDFLETALQHSSTGLYSVPPSTQLLFPDLIIRTMENDGPDTYDDLEEYIEDDLFENRDFALAWVRQGRQLHELDRYRDDEEVLLAVAEHDFVWFEEFAADEELLEDRDFVLKAVARNGRLWPLLDEAWKEDFGIGVVAFGATPDLAYHCARDEFSRITELAKHVRVKLDEQKVFAKWILGSIECAGTECPLHLLNQGRDTSLVYKRTIAECLDIVSGARLQQLRKVSDNLARWGF